jgi:hypothetical protein
MSIATGDKCENCGLDAKRMVVIHKLYKCLLENIDCRGLMDIDKCDDDMLRILIQDSVIVSSQLIRDIRTSLDIVKFAIDDLFSKGELNGYIIEVAVCSRDIERLKYIMLKMTAEYMSIHDVIINNRSVQTAIIGDRIDVVQCLIDNGYKNTNKATLRFMHSVYDAGICDENMAEMLYNMGVDICSYDLKFAFQERMDLRFKNRFLWLYGKSPDVCDPETKAAAIALGWITE